jgi:hypothetical protein
MTAEIAILNRSAVAMAADSAVTMSMGRNHKIFPTANKIFALSNTEPVGIMIYGGAEFMGVPWETVIKVLRGRLKDKSFAHLSDYTKWFRETLAGAKDIVVGQATEDYVAQCVLSYFDFIIQEAGERIKEHLAKNTAMTEAEAAAIYAATIEKHTCLWQKGEPMVGITKAQVTVIKREIGQHIDELIKAAFVNLPLTKKMRADLRLLAESIFCRESQIERMADSGVVIAGFGRSQIFPAITSMDIRGVINGVLQWRMRHDIDMVKQQYGAIIPFAQTDEVYNFLEGIHPDYQVRLQSDFRDILAKATEIVLAEVKGADDAEKTRARDAVADKLKAEFEAYQDKLRKFRSDQYSMPILQVLDGTPKDQLASMAEALVNLTSFKRRVSMQAETVGGPIDVALISKGDGLVWVKRKHYFPADLNHQFFSRYNRDLP